jgi:hypothetical protein
MSYSMALRRFARMIVTVRMVYGVMGEVGEVLLELLLAVVRECVRHCVDVLATVGRSLAQPQPLRLLR